jgi:hypothetical protein
VQRQRIFQTCDKATLEAVSYVKQLSADVVYPYFHGHSRVMAGQVAHGCWLGIFMNNMLIPNVEKLVANKGPQFGTDGNRIYGTYVRDWG